MAQNFLEVIIMYLTSFLTFLDSVDYGSLGQLVLYDYICGRLYLFCMSYHTFEQVERSMERVEVKDKNDLAVFDWFRTYVIGTKLDTSIGHHDLVGHY